jgi:hypothetical protein
MTPTHTTLPIDYDFNTDFADDLARLESYNKNLYRPNTYLHKWWARRCGTTFRAILKQLVDEDRGRDYYASGGLEELWVFGISWGTGNPCGCPTLGRHKASPYIWYQPPEFTKSQNCDIKLYRNICADR